MRWPAVPALVCLLAACVADDSGLPVATATGNAGARYTAVSYSPDGTRISYWQPTSDGAGGWQLWSANADMSEPVNLRVTSGITFSPQPALWSPDGSRLATTSGDLGAGDVVVVPATGGEIVYVTEAPGLEVPVSWYDDGDRIAFYAGIEGGRVVGRSVAVSTGEAQAMIPGETRQHIARPSRDGSHIAYFVYDAPAITIWVADSAGRNPRPLTTEGFEELSMAEPWSPDGREIVYVSTRTGTADIWVASVDGGAPRQLTRDIRNDYAPTWSPDGKWIAFLSDRGRQTDLWVVPAAGGEALRVTDSTEEEVGQPVWVPGGAATLAFTQVVEQSGVWTLDLATGTERRLTPDSVRTSDFWLSNAGDQVNVVIPRGGDARELAVVPLAGGPMRTLLPGTGTIRLPRWSPDDSLITFTSNRAGSPDVWVVDVATGATRNLTPWPESWESAATWTAPDGLIAFHSDRTKPWGDVWVVNPASGDARQITRDGSINDVMAHASTDVIVATTIDDRAGEFVLRRVGRDGVLQPVWDRTNAFANAISFDGTWLAAMVEQHDGQMRGSLVPVNGGEPRVVLGPGGDSFLSWSRDDARILYVTQVDGVGDIAVLTIADGSTQRLTTTPEREWGAEFTPDGNTVVFGRTRTEQRVYTVDVSALLARRQKTQ